MKRILILLLFLFALNSLFSQTSDSYLTAKVIYIGDVWYAQLKEPKTFLVSYQILVHANNGKFYTRNVIAELDAKMKPKEQSQFYCLLCDFKIYSKDKYNWKLYSPKDDTLFEDLHFAYKSYEYFLSK